MAWSRVVMFKWLTASLKDSFHQIEPRASPRYDAPVSRWRVDDRVQGRGDDLADFCPATPPVPITLLILVLGCGETHVGIHVNNRHDLARDGALVRAGTVERPAVMITDFAEVERCFVLREFLVEEQLADFLFAVVADFEVAAHLSEVTALAERQWAEFKRRGLERDPVGAGVGLASGQ